MLKYSNYRKYWYYIYKKGRDILHIGISNFQFYIIAFAHCKQTVTAAMFMAAKSGVGDSVCRFSLDYKLGFWLLQHDENNFLLLY